MSKSTQAKLSKAQRRRQKPSAPRQIGANDNAALIANDNSVLTVGGVRLNDGQARRFRQAVEDQASGDYHRRVAGRDLMVGLERELSHAANENRRQTDEAEFVALEEARGSIIETSDRQEHKGRKRVVSRDGLETLLTSSSITRIQHVAGMRYRDDYEAIDPEKGLTPPAIDQTRNIVRGGDGYAQKRREIEDRVFGIKLMICGVERGVDGKASLPRLPAGHPAMRAIHALDAIAGRGDNLGTMTTSGSVKARIREDLIFALDACAIIYGLE